jgi:hypothetical protein
MHLMAIMAAYALAYASHPRAKQTMHLLAAMAAYALVMQQW